jgi:hypothetical protein
VVASRLRNAAAFATNWGGGGVQRTTNYGDSWPTVSTVAAAWGLDIARDDPNVVAFATYSGGQSYLSIDGGTSFVNVPLPGTNYALLLRDRGLALAQQSIGVFKLAFRYAYAPDNTQALALVSPNGGESLVAGQVHDVRWTSSNVARVRIDYRRDAASAWIHLDEVAGHRGRYAWVVPNDATEGGEVRVSDAWDLDPADSSIAGFTIAGGTSGVAERRPGPFELSPNRPNPFTGSTTIGFRLPIACNALLEVFDLTGHRVATLARGRRSAGEHTVTFHAGARGARAGRAGPGIYFYRLRAGGFSHTRKMLVLE